MKEPLPTDNIYLNLSRRGGGYVNVKVVESAGVRVALVESDVPLISDIQSTLDLIARLWYESGCDRMVLQQTTVSPDFFKLRTGLAGEVLQKFINYQAKLAIVGDFSQYQSKPLLDFIRESNSGRDVFFVANEDEAIARLAKA